MTRTVLLPYGARPYPLDVGQGALVSDLPSPPAPRDLEASLREALDAPIESPRLEDVVRPGDRVAVAVSDQTRDDPRRAYLEALFERLPSAEKVTLLVANGTHAPADPSGLGLGPVASGLPLVNHDGADPSSCVVVGYSSRGTPFRIQRAATEADWLIATGQIKPHYFAGFGGGVKALFPGLGESSAIRRNHELKRRPRAAAGVVHDNPCRLDMEEALRFLPASFLLNSLHDALQQCQGAVAGGVVAGWRHGASFCGELYRVAAAPRRTVVVSDREPLTSSLYQASKLAATAAPWATEHLVIVAECREGIGPRDVVARGIFEPGIKPRLRDPAPEIWLVSGLPPSEVAGTYCRAAARVEDIPGLDLETALVLPRAGVSLCAEVAPAAGAPKVGS